MCPQGILSVLPVGDFVQIAQHDGRGFWRSVAAALQSRKRDPDLEQEGSELLGWSSYLCRNSR